MEHGATISKHIESKSLGKRSRPGVRHYVSTNLQLEDPGGGAGLGSRRRGEVVGWITDEVEVGRGWCGGGLDGTARA
jgi:hypothetical protein